MAIIVQTEARRGCGYRKPGKNGLGIYLIGDALSKPCGRLPFPLTVCPCCSAGIKPARGWTWISPQQLFGVLTKPCAARAEGGRFKKTSCGLCPLGGALPEGRHGLLWVGEAFYATPHEFTREAARLGISRKLAALPRGFQLGETFVYLAHRHAVIRETPTGPVASAGVFQVFKPTGVDIVIDPGVEEAPEQATRLAEQIGTGARIVQVVRDEDTQTNLFDPEPPPQTQRSEAACTTNSTTSLTTN